MTNAAQWKAMAERLHELLCRAKYGVMGDASLYSAIQHARIDFDRLAAETEQPNDGAGSILDYLLQPQTIRLHCGELNAQELRIAQSIIRWVHAEFAKAQPPPVVPDGWQLVPKEPTQAMLDAALSTRSSWGIGMIGPVSRGYQAMLAAAPRVTDETGEGK